MDDSYRISDPQVLKAVTHPLRSRMLGLLRAEGPATASELGRKVGESSGLTSYHLRELAKYGFIEEDPEQRDGRERRWRARHRYTSWDNKDMAATPEGREVLEVMRMRQLDALVRSVRSFDASAWPAEWGDVSGMSDLLVRLTPEGVREYFRRIDELRDEMEERYGDDPAAQQVYLGLTAYPRSPSAPEDTPASASEDSEGGEAR
ncbi:helix-turn-helix domain-containing protein [Nonomuraea sp. NPDC046570]|uniref:helix-turn-helix domain-containing protein n=1 Tax=Nonomuraea sp. NPDC046570 TaxID=3155255 RepID=UPI0033EB079D